MTLALKRVALPIRKGTRKHYVQDLLCLAEEESAFAIVLLGSVARRRRSAFWSDLDLLAVNIVAPPAPPSVHLIQLKKSELVTRLRNRDDFVQWALRFGRPIYGVEAWTRFAEERLAEAPWPDPTIKLGHSRVRLAVASKLADVGDATSGQKEAIYAASHLARAVLLSRGIFPLSRPELPSQLKRLGMVGLSEILLRLSEPSVGLDALRSDINRLAREMDSAATAVA